MKRAQTSGILALARLLLLVLVTIVGCAQSGRSERHRVLVDARSGEPASVAIYARSSNALEQREDLDTIAVAAWSDGTIVWCDDRLGGGRPLHRAKIDAERVIALTRDVMQRMARVPLLDRYNVGPDSFYTSLVAYQGDRCLELASWHERYERSPQLVAMDVGLRPVDSRGREAMLATCKPSYLEFRKIWSDARASIETLIPPNGDPCDGADLRFEWRE